MTNGTPVRAVDRVAVAGAVIALAGGLLLPLVEFRANRIVSGDLHSTWDAAGPVGWLLLALLAASLAAAWLPRAIRGSALLAGGVASLSAWLLALGGAAGRLMPGGGSSARVSVASGAWLMLVGIAVIWFQGSRAVRWQWARVAAVAVTLAATLAAWFVGGLPNLSLVTEYYRQDAFWMLTYSHIGLSIGGTAIAVMLGVPLGIAAARTAIVRSTVIPVAGIIQTIPSLALYGLLIVPLGMLGLPTLGAVPTLIALTLYALLPIVRNTYLGVSGVDPAIVDAGRGMGMRRSELLLRVELPLALPLLLEGVRVSLVMTVGVAAVMAIASAETLGRLIFEGWGETAVDLVLLGAIPMVVISIIADQIMRILQRTVVSPGIRVVDGQD
ncbi:MAG TPA: ABC transporter permease [Coriobacteriia bacterium]